MVLRRGRLAAPLVALALSVPTGAATGDPGVGGFMSPNVSWGGAIPIDLPGIGAKVVQVGAQRRFYVTGLRGLSIYDVTNPAIPLPLGHLELPHFENEAVSVAADGSVAFVSSDVSPQTYVIDTTIPQVPRIASIIPDGTHTLACANPGCTVVYASDRWAYDVSDRANPREIGGWGGGGHAANLDAGGFVVSDGGLQVFDPRKNPKNPKLLTSAASTGRRGAFSWGHNNIRPDAQKWRPRKPGDKGKVLRPGELLLTGGETLTTVNCPGGSGISSWSMVDFEKGKRLQPLDSFFPRKGTYADGNPAANALGCSSHWFDYRNGVVAAGWYENGIRFFRVDQRTGDISEVGWFQPVNTEAWAAYWIDDETVYTLDAVRGIDILTFSRDRKAPTQSQSDASWALPAHRPLTFVTQRERMLCSFAQRG